MNLPIALLLSFFMCTSVLFSKELQQIDDESLKMYASHVDDSNFVEALGWQSVYYENIVFKNNFYQQLNDFKQYRYSNPIHAIGYTQAANFRLTHYISYTPGIDFGFYIPQKIQLNDTISSKISGYDFNLRLVSFDFFKMKSIFHVNVGAALRMGRLRLKNKEVKDLQNFFLGPSFFVEPSFRIKNSFRIGLKADYFFDITKGNWKRLLFSKKHELYPTNAFNQEAMRFQVFFSIIMQ